MTAGNLQTVWVWKALDREDGPADTVCVCVLRRLFKMYAAGACAACQSWMSLWQLQHSNSQTQQQDWIYEFLKHVTYIITVRI